MNSSENGCYTVSMHVIPFLNKCEQTFSLNNDLAALLQFIEPSKQPYCSYHSNIPLRTHHIINPNFTFPFKTSAQYLYLRKNNY